MKMNKGQLESRSNLAISYQQRIQLGSPYTCTKIDGLGNEKLKSITKFLTYDSASRVAIFYTMLLQHQQCNVCVRLQLRSSEL